MRRRPALWTVLGFGLGIALGRMVDFSLESVAVACAMAWLCAGMMLYKGCALGIGACGGIAGGIALPGRYSAVPFAVHARARGLWAARCGQRADRRGTRARR